MQIVQATVDADGIALLSIDNPASPMNILTPAFFSEFANAVERLAADPGVRGVIVASAKPGVFTAGVDVNVLAAAFERGLTVADGLELSRAVSGPLRRVETCGKPIVCALHGLALGGGVELALACHYRVMADDGSVGLPEIKLGLLPGGGTTQRLLRLLGIEKAAAVLLSGRQIRAAEALQIGLVHDVRKADELILAAKAWLLASSQAVQPWDVAGFQVPGGAVTAAPGALRQCDVGTMLAAQNTQRHEPAPFAILSCLCEGGPVAFDVGLRIEASYFAPLYAGAVARNLMRTRFLSKRAADRLERRPTGVPKSTVSRVGILGAGTMGAGIAFVSSAAGMAVILLDTTLGRARGGRQYSATLIRKAVAQGKITPAQAEAQLACIQPTLDYADLAACDLVIEAVGEDRTVAADMISKAAAAMHETALFASSTSTLAITALASAFAAPASFIGIHFSAPIEKTPLVEIVMGAQTSQTALARALDYVAQLGKTPIVINDSPGGFTRRIFATLMREGAFLLDEGVDPALIENAARQAGFAAGPLAASEAMTFDVQIRIAEQNMADTQSEAPENKRWLAILRKMAGRETAFSRHPSQPAIDALEKRLLYVQALEAARCVEEGVVSSAADADVGSVFGIGFPAWTGGVLSLIDTVGLPAFVDECERMASIHGERFRPSAWLHGRAREGVSFYPPRAQTGQTPNIGRTADDAAVVLS